MNSQYISTATIAEWFGVGVRAVTVWIGRYPDFPKADVSIPRNEGFTRAWLPEREQEIREWHANRSGQGKRNDLAEDK